MVDDGEPAVRNDGGAPASEIDIGLDAAELALMDQPLKREPRGVAAEQLGRDEDVAAGRDMAQLVIVFRHLARPEARGDRNAKRLDVVAPLRPQDKNLGA